MESWSEFAYIKMMYLQFRGLWILKIFKYQTSGGTIFIPKGLKELLYVLNFYSDSERERKRGMWKRNRKIPQHIKITMCIK